MLHPVDEVESLHKVIDQVVIPLTTMCNDVILPLKRAFSTIFCKFLLSTMILKHSFQAIRYQI